MAVEKHVSPASILPYPAPSRALPLLTSEFCINTFWEILPTGISLVSHPFRSKKRGMDGAPQVYSESKNALKPCRFNAKML
jgi:hypothetical protein